MKKSSIVAFGGIALLILGSWGAWFFIQFNQTGDDATARAGQIGDKFGALNCLFTGFGLVGVAAGLWTQHQDSDREKKEAKEKRSREERGILRAIFDEMELAWTNYETVKAYIEDEKNNPLFIIRVQRPIAFFPVYAANAGELGKIDDHTLRRTLIEAHGLHAGMVMLMIANTEFLDEFERAERALKVSNTAENEGWRNHRRVLLEAQTATIRRLNIKMTWTRDRLLPLIAQARDRIEKAEV